MTGRMDGPWYLYVPVRVHSSAGYKSYLTNVQTSKVMILYRRNIAEIHNENVKCKNKNKQ